MAVKFRDLGGFENLSINGSPVIVGELSSGAAGGLTWTVSDFPVAGGREGKLTVDGSVHSLQLGGQEFWIDTLCVITTERPGRAAHPLRQPGSSRSTTPTPTLSSMRCARARPRGGSGPRTSSVAGS